VGKNGGQSRGVGETAADNRLRQEGGTVFRLKLLVGPSKNNTEKKSRMTERDRCNRWEGETCQKTGKETLKLEARVCNPTRKREAATENPDEMERGSKSEGGKISWQRISRTVAGKKRKELTCAS